MAGAPFLPASRDTIFAPASGAGRAAIAVIRVSGPRCAAALAALAPGKAFPDRVATLATLRDPASGETLDRALVVRFVAPRSFTGEEMAELQATGGRATVAGIVAALARLPGLRPAEAGEFAWRAFENGKLDLVRGRGPRRPRRRRDRGATAAGAANRRRRAEPRRRGDPRLARRGDGADRGADRFFRRRGFRRAVARPGARDRRRGGGADAARRSPAPRRASGCARASPSSSPARPTSASRR